MTVIDNTAFQGHIAEQGWMSGLLGGPQLGHFGATAGYHEVPATQPKALEGLRAPDAGTWTAYVVIAGCETLATIAIVDAIGPGQTEEAYGSELCDFLKGGCQAIALRTVEAPSTDSYYTTRVFHSQAHFPRGWEADSDEPGFEFVARPVEPPAPPAWRAFKDLGLWLALDDAAVADAVGIGRTTVYSWRSKGHEPRRATARRIFEMHSVLGALRRRLGFDDFEFWLQAGSPSHRVLLAAGDLEAVQADVDEILFGSAQAGPDLSWAPPDREAAGPVAEAEPRRAGPRKARRVRYK